MPQALTRLFITRLFVASLSVVVVSVAACGSDTDNDQADTASTVSPQPAEPDAAQPETTQSETAPSTEGASATAAQPTTAVQLGNRFEWCAEVQTGWDGHTAALMAADEATEALSRAAAAHAAATDELDAAEAAAVLEAAEYAYLDALGGVDWHAEAAIEPLLRSAAPEDWHGDDTQDIAYARAWEAFTSHATPAELDLVQLPRELYWDLSNDALFEAQAAFEDTYSEYRERGLGPDDMESLSEDELNEALETVVAFAIPFSTEWAALIDESLAQQDALRDAVAAARDARDAGVPADAAAAAVEAFWLIPEIAVSYRTALEFEYTSEGLEVNIQRFTDHADASGQSINTQLVDDAVTAIAAAAESQAMMIDQISSYGSGYWDPWGSGVPEQALSPASSAAYDAILSHSTAHAAFVESLQDSCR